MTAEMENEIRDLPRVSNRGCQCHTIKRVPLFEVEGDKNHAAMVYTVPEYLEAHVTYDYLEVLESRGSDSAFRWAMVTVLGHEGWAAARSPGMDEETFDVIGKAVIDLVKGANKRGPKASS